jgi:dolichol kinase
MSEPWSADALDSPAVLHESASVPRVHAEDVAPAHAVSDRPSNLRRSAFHVASAIVSLLFTLVVFDSRQLPFVAGTFALTFWGLEALRRPFPRFNVLLMRFFAPIAHPKEREEVNSATWYVTALTLLALSHSQILCTIGVAVLGLGDPVASAVGRRFGRVELLRRRTLEGSLAFVVAATIAAALAVAFAIPRLPMGVLLAVSFVASLSGAVAEICSRKMDDNFTIPLAAAIAATVALAVLGYSPWG